MSGRPTFRLAVGSSIAITLLAVAAALWPASPANAAEAVETTRTLQRDAVIARHADAASRFVDLDGVAVHYKDEGQGPVLLLVHGTYGDLGDWDGWVEAFRGSWRVVRLDLPGFGMTGPLASGNYSADRLLGLIDSLMDRLGIERFAIGGVSYGGLVSWRYAATRTERVTALLLANSAGVEAGARGSTAPAGYNILTDPKVAASDVETFLRFLLSDPSRITPALVQRKLDFSNTAGRAEESVAGRRLYERGDPERVLAHVRAPVLVQWGAAGRALTVTTADAFVAALKNACTTQRIVYADAGHMMNIDRPRETAADAKAFLDRHNGCRKP